MKRRDLDKLVASEAQCAGGADLLLKRATSTMRAARQLPADDSVRQLDGPGWEGLFAQDDALGQIYQTLNAPALERAYRATARERRKFSKQEIPAVTQLFTPRFVVELLLRETLGRLSNDGKRVRDIRILDPACGTMNFGVVAVEMLDVMYRQELARLGPQHASVQSEDQIPAAILRHNLFGVDIDPVVRELAAQTLSMKLRVPVEQCRQNLRLADSLLDNVGEGFDCVVTNPPYLSARNLAARTVAKLKRRYAGWRDAYACFIERSLALVRDGGYVGILAMHSFMFTGGFEKLRRKLAESSAIERIVHFGPGLFEIGNPGTLQTAVIVLRREADATRRDETEVIAMRLVEAEDKQAAMRDRCSSFNLRQRDLVSAPRGAWVYWLTPDLREIFHQMPALRTIAEPKQGLATTDNARFVRYWWEVEPTRPDAPYRASPNTWVAYAKSGRFRRWFESPRHRVNWADDGREIKQNIAHRYPYLNGHWKWVAKNSQYYGRPGVTYSYLTTGTFSARLLPAGAIFDVAGSALFPSDPLTLLAILNSSTARRLLQIVNPTVNFQVGDLARLPLPCERDDELAGLADRAVQLQQRLDTFDETAPEFAAPPTWEDGVESGDSIVKELVAIERQIDATVASLYGLTDHVAQADRCGRSITQIELARRWVSFALGRLLGRWGGERRLKILTIPISSTALDLIRAELAHFAGAESAAEIERCIGPIDAFLAGPFYAWHLRLYHNRPVYWLLGDQDRADLVLHDFASPDLLKVPSRWQRFIDDGVSVNLAPLAPWIRDRELAKRLGQVADDLKEGRFEWSRTSRAMREARFNREPNCGCAARSARRLPWAPGSPAGHT